jgi:hypothetical protein
MIRDVGFAANVRRVHRMRQRVPAYSNGYGTVNERAETTVVRPGLSALMHRLCLIFTHELIAVQSLPPM